MPSHLRLQSSFEPFEADAHYQTSPTLHLQKKQKMSLTRTYAVASTARSKLGREASRADHDLRLLVGHANLLDTLMIELADAEREQEAWFNSTVRKAAKPDEPRHIQWIDTIAEDLEDEESDSDSDSEADSDVYDEDAELYNIPLRKMRSPPVVTESADIDEDEDEDDEDFEDFDAEYDAEHALTRVPSKHSPPELLIEEDDSEESEDDSMPPSPEQPMFELSEKQQKQVMNHTAAFFDSKAQSIESYVLQQPQQPLIAAC